MTQKDSYLFKTNIILMFHFQIFFVLLLAGAKLHITEKTFNIQEIEKLIKENSINICHFVPSQFKIFSEEVDLNKLTSLNKIMLSGESIELKQIKKYLNNDRKFYNYYGPTETGEVTVKCSLLQALKLQ